MNPYGLTPKNFEENRLIQFISDEVPEGKWLEYKLCLPSFDGSEDKKEFLADVSSFANTSGGLILYGISEQKNENGKNTGLPEAIEGLGEKTNLDQECLRLENLLRDGLSPRITGLQIIRLQLFNKNQILAIFIPRSWNNPHAVIMGGSMRFYSRNSAGKYQLDIGEIRSAFLNQNNLTEQLRLFPRERRGLIRRGQIPIALEDGPKVIAHIQPLDQTQSIDLISLNQDFQSLKFIYFTQIQLCRFNLDGLFFHNFIREGKAKTYTQIFGNGNIEGVTSHLIDPNQESLAYITVEDKIIYFFDHYRSVLQKYEIHPPYLFSLTITEVKGKKLLDRDPHFITNPENYTFDRDILELPDVLVDDMEANMEIILRPILDALWQAAGWPGSVSYNDQGQWIRTQRERR